MIHGWYHNTLGKSSTPSPAPEDSLTLPPQLNIWPYARTFVTLGWLEATLVDDRTLVIERVSIVAKDNILKEVWVRCFARAQNTFLFYIIYAGFEYEFHCPLSYPYPNNRRQCKLE
jgi:hypothetical protein